MLVNVLFKNGRIKANIVIKMVEEKPYHNCPGISMDLAATASKYKWSSQNDLPLVVFCIIA